MEKNNKIFALILVLFAAVIFLGFSLFKSIQRNEELRLLIPYLLPGEKIETLALICVDEKDQDITALEKDRLYLLYVFPRTKCTVCDKNLVVLKKVQKLLKGDISILGILLKTPTEAMDFAQKASLNFPIYVPGEIEKFIDLVRIKMNLSQAIICTGNEVRRIEMGDLTGGKAGELVKLLRRLNEEMISKRRTN